MRRSDLTEGMAGFEACDDGNADPTDGCLPGCLAARCGDGVVYAGEEQCDDGNAVDDDACSNACVANLLPSRVVEGLPLIHDYYGVSEAHVDGPIRRALAGLGWTRSRARASTTERFVAGAGTWRGSTRPDFTAR